MENTIKAKSFGGDFKSNISLPIPSKICINTLAAVCRQKINNVRDRLASCRIIPHRRRKVCGDRKKKHLLKIDFAIWYPIECGHFETISYYLLTFILLQRIIAFVLLMAIYLNGTFSFFRFAVFRFFFLASYRRFD